MTPPVVRATHLRRVFKVPERDAGLVAAAKSLVKRRYREINAVDGISFEIEEGEVVGFLGPNGAGKTTTLKIASGLLQPSGGEINVMGYTPGRRDRDYLRRMSLLAGNRSQLQWDIPVIDSYELTRTIYRIPSSKYHAIKNELVELLDVGRLLRKPVRSLSLGERMKVEIVGALLHVPTVLFLDEPTLGLDLTMQKRLREFVAAYNRRYGATILLTSHYMADVEALCERVILIDRGTIRYDGALTTLSAQVAAYKEVTVALATGTLDLSAYGSVVTRPDGAVALRVPQADVPRVTSLLLAEHDVLDLTVVAPPLEDVLETLFAH